MTQHLRRLKDKASLEKQRIRLKVKTKGDYCVHQAKEWKKMAKSLGTPNES